MSANDIQEEKKNLGFSAPFVLTYCSPSQDVLPSFEATPYDCPLVDVMSVNTHETQLKKLAHGLLFG